MLRGKNIIEDFHYESTLLWLWKNYSSGLEFHSAPCSVEKDSERIFFTNLPFDDGSGRTTNYSWKAIRSALKWAKLSASTLATNSIAQFCFNKLQ